jgi:Zn-dependent peptidase ImmA (M78 family)
MLDFNYRMLILAREARGLTQTELSKRTNTDQGNLSKIEKGLSKPTDELLEKYASELNFPISFFKQHPNKTIMSDFFYRKRITMPAKEKTKLEAQIDILRLVYEKLLKSVEIPEAKFPSAGVNRNFTPSDVAKLTREFYKVPKGPIKEFIGLLERNGIAVVFIDVPSTKFDGMTVYTDSNYPMIVLNKNMPNDRKKFTIAHELGHQVMHLPYRFDFDMYERLKSDPNALEKEANSFAAEFLMPENDCRSDLKNITYSKLSHLKLYWQVSKKYIIYSAKTLNCIEDKQYENLLIELSRNGERVKESFDVDIDQPKIMKQLFNAYTQHLGFTQKELADHLSITETDLLDLVKLNNTYKLKIAI